MTKFAHFLAVAAVFVLAVALGSGLAAMRQGSGSALSSGTPPSASPSLVSPTRDPRLNPSPRATPTGTIPALSAVTPQRWPAATAADVALNIRSDAFAMETLHDVATAGSPVFNAQARSLTLGQPVLVRPLVSTSLPIWLVPVLSSGQVIGVIGARLEPDGMATAGEYAGWSGPFPHPLSLPDALAQGSAPGDPAVSAELVWAIISPME